MPDVESNGDAEQLVIHPLSRTSYHVSLRASTQNCSQPSSQMLHKGRLPRSGRFCRSHLRTLRKWMKRHKTPDEVSVSEENLKMAPWNVRLCIMSLSRSKLKLPRFYWNCAPLCPNHSTTCRSDPVLIQLQHALAVFWNKGKDNINFWWHPSMHLRL